MIRARTTGRGNGRGVQTLATLRPAAILVACVALLAAIAPACSPNSPTTPPSTAASSPPASSGSPGAALPTPWPGNSVLGIEAIGVADGQIGAAVTDLNRGVSEEDLVLMRQAADGLSGLADALLPNVEDIRLNPAMVPFADKYEAAITSIDDAATRLRDAIDAGDAPGIATATQDLLNSLSLYAALQGELAAWIEQMPEQKRMLLR